MEVNPARRILLATQHLAQLLNQDTGHLHSLTVAAKMHNLAYAPNIQASLENILVRMQTDLRKVIEVFDAHVQEAIDKRIEILQQTVYTDESMETISNTGSPLRAFTPMLGEEDDSIFLEDSLLIDRSSEGERRMETNLDAS